MTQKAYEAHASRVEAREQRRGARELRIEQGEGDVSEDSDDDEIDRYAALTDRERWNRMMNEARAIMRAEEEQRLKQKDKKGHNVLQNMAIKQANAATDAMQRRERAIHDQVAQIEVLQDELVILEPLSCVHTTLEMCLIGYKEAMRFLARGDITQQFEKASLLQCKMSVETIFRQRRSPIQVKAEMLWRFAVVMQDFNHGSYERDKYLRLAMYASSILRVLIAKETKRREKVRAKGSDEEKARLQLPAEWEVEQPELFWELAALINGLEQQRDDEDMCTLHRRMERANNVSSLAVLREKPRKIPIPPDVLPPE